MASAKNNQLFSSQGPHFSPRSTAKTNNKSSGRKASIGISDVVTISVYSEKTRMKVDDDENDNCYYYYESIARNDGFSRAPEIDFRYETKARKVMIDFKFDALYS